MPVFAFIDTNVLLHYRFFRDVDWAAVVSAPEVVLVFAPVVLSELDEHRRSGSRREKPRAKAVLQDIDDLGLATDAVCPPLPWRMTHRRTVGRYSKRAAR